MTRDELLRTHPDYDGMAPRWTFWEAAYEGVDALLEWGVLRQYALEGDADFKDRKAEAVGFEYSSAVVDLFAELLTTKPVTRDWGPLAKDPLWTLFMDDCDLDGAALSPFLLEQQRMASVFGHVGILVDKPADDAPSPTRLRAIEAGVYPYLAAFTPPDILDWRYIRRRGRRVLVMVKLREEGGTILLYRMDRWERWRVEDEFGTTLKEPILEGQGAHGLGEVPFVWLTNRRNKRRHPTRLPMGRSDLKAAAKLDASIMRDMSLINEVNKHGAFPMLRVPGSGPSVMTGQQEQAVGPAAVLEFDHREGEAAKPDWLESAVQAPVEALTETITLKRRELYRATNIGGLQLTDDSKDAKSGTALRQEFRSLNAVLSAKAEALEEAELKLCWLWCKWQGQEDAYAKVAVEWPRTFDMEDLAEDLANGLTLQNLVPDSPTFQRLLKLSFANRLPAAQEHLRQIEQELKDKDQQAQTESTQIFRYHLEAGLVTVNEVRARLGLAPVSGGERMITAEDLAAVREGDGQ